MERVPAPSQIEAFSNLSTFLSSVLQEEPPGLAEILSDSQFLQKLADLATSLLHAAEAEVLSDESISLIETAFRHILFQHARQLRTSARAESARSRRQSQAEVKSQVSELSEDVQLLKIEHQELRRKVRLISDLQKESSAQQQEIEGLYSEKGRLVQKMQQQKRQHDDEVSRNQMDYGLLQNEYRDSLVRLEGAESKIAGLESLVKMARAESEAVSKQCDALKGKLERKREENMKLKTEIAKLRQGVKDAEFQKEAARVESSAMHRSMMSDAALEQENRVLRQQMKAQQVKMADMEARLEKVRAAKVAAEERTYALEEDYRKAEASIEDAERRLARQDQKNAELEEELKQVTEEAKSHMEMSTQNTREVLGMRSVLSAVTDIVSRYHMIDEPEDLPGTLDALLKNMESMKFEKQSQLCSVIDGLTRFIESMMSGSPNVQLLMSPAAPILGDPTLVQEINEHLEKTRELIGELTENGFKGMIQFDSLISAVPHFAQDKTNGEFASLSVMCSVNEMLRREILRQDEMILDACALLGIQYDDCNRADVRSNVMEFAENLKTTAARMYTILRTFYGCTRDNGLLATVNQYTELSYQLAENVKSGLQISCNLLNMKLIDVPGKVTETIREINDDHNAIRLQMREKYEHQIEDLTHEIDAQKATIESQKQTITNIKNTNMELSSKVTKLSSENYVLKEQLDEAVETRKDMENTFATFHAKNGEIEETARIIKVERDRLLRLLEDKEAHFESRLAMALQTERNAHSLEVARLKTMLDDQTKRAKERLAQKTQKLNAELSQARELIDTLEKSNEQQKTTISRMKVPDQSSFVGSTMITDDDPFLSKLTTELDKCISINGSWTHHKVMSAVRRLVAKYIDQNNERWMEWASNLVGSHNLTGSQLRRMIAAQFQDHS